MKDYVCSECSTQLTDFEIELNELYPVGKLFCEDCQTKHEKKLIKMLKKNIIINKIKKGLKISFLSHLVFNNC